MELDDALNIKYLAAEVQAGDTDSDVELNIIACKLGYGIDGKENMIIDAHLMASGIYVENPSWTEYRPVLAVKEPTQFITYHFNLMTYLTGRRVAIQVMKIDGPPPSIVTDGDSAFDPYEGYTPEAKANLEHFKGMAW